MKYLYNKPVMFIGENDNDALIAEEWVRESLMILDASCVMLPRVHTDYKRAIASHGDVVNCNRPAKFEAERKVDGDDVTVQDATTAKVPIRLDHHLHTSFMIYDGEDSKSFKELVDQYLGPAMQSLSQEIDEIICAQKWQFRLKMVGKAGTDITKSTLTAINKQMNKLLVPQGNDRTFAFGPDMEENLLNESLFTDASQVGDDGTALREASLGKKFGMHNIQTQNMFTVDATDSQAAAINNTAGYAAGTKTFAIDATTSDTIAIGQWITIAGDMQPRQITAASGTPIDSITVDTGLSYAVADNAVVTVMSPGAIDLTAGYAQYYTKRMTVDGFTIAPQQGQLLSMGVTTPEYGLIGGKNSATSIKLDRSLEAAVVDDATVNLGPAGNYGLAFHKNAIAFITRPLAISRENGNSTRQAVFSYKGLNLRVSMTYNGSKQGTLVTIDCLAGVKVLDENLGVLVCG